MKHVLLSASISESISDKVKEVADKYDLNKSQLVNIALQYYLDCVEAGLVQPTLYTSRSSVQQPREIVNTTNDNKSVAEIVAEQKKKARAEIMSPSEIAEMEEIERKGSYDPDLERELENRKIVLANSLN